MKTLLVILLIALVSGDKFHNGMHWVERSWEHKCHRTQVEDHIYDYNVRNRSLLYLPSLKSLKKRYPGDKFSLSQDNACADIDPVFGVDCSWFVERGHCVGADSQHQEMVNKQFQDLALKEGFHTRRSDQVSVHQISKMMSNCRESCKKWIKENPDKVPPEMDQFFGWEDVLKDEFGVELHPCVLGNGNTIKANEGRLSMTATSLNQGKIVPRFTKVGFEKQKIPKQLYATILSNRKKLLKGGAKWKIEYCAEGIQNCQRVYESEVAQECHIVSSEKYWFLDLDVGTKKSIFEQMRPLAEKWIGNKIQLMGTAAYGLRKYTRGATLGGHVDRLDTHVISAILNIHQSVDSDWPLQIFDHDDRLHHIILKPGEMVWYESAKLIHGRSIPLNGTSFENIFIHYVPVAARRGKWYSENYNVVFGDPVNLITLDTLIQDAIEESKSSEFKTPLEKEELLKTL